MPIFEELHQAFVNAVEEYKTVKRNNGQSISEHRLLELEQLTGILQTSNMPNYRDAVLLRKRVAHFVGNMDVPFLAVFFSNFDSDLRKKLKGVLDHPDYDETSLEARERAEAKERDTQARKHDLEADNISILDHFDNPNFLELAKQVKVLTQELEIERNRVTKLEQTIESQNQAFEKLKSAYKELKNKNTQLTQENTTLKTEIRNLTTENNLLQARIAELERNAQPAVRY